ncbi:hypothetical protein N7508_003038 [Penicillium antarcticum]|uniref:uncharacterized protein n=1 Tax=Penicillium antarcticum TaxID=416450 RepID=UPI0023998D48|nr:uncharacterized protein N7508_003038 [Penicillium antarcticum]KAJ5312208.1 hypothetical protein N7508_003038 [Penicillium antarcticum]
MESLFTVRVSMHKLWPEVNLNIEDKLDIEALQKEMNKKADLHEPNPNTAEPSGKLGDTEANLDDQEDDSGPPNEDADTANGQSSQPEGQSEDTNKTDHPAVAEFRKTSVFSTRSLGHPVGLRVSYPRSSIRYYQVEITKPCSWAQSS